MSTSHPLAASRSQSAKPVEHVPTAQRPDTHATVAFASDAHAIPHAPQWASSVAVVTQRPAQSVCPIGHAHCPMTQAVPPVRATPHAPQWSDDVARFTQAPAHAV